MANDLAVAYESDGVGLGGFERKSAEIKGSSIGEYRQQTLDTAKNSGIPSLQKAADFLENRQWTNEAINPVDDDKAMKDFLAKTPYSHGPAKGYDYDLSQGQEMTQRRFWDYMHRRGLAWESDWQASAAVSYVDEAGVATPADSSMLPSMASHGKATNNAPLGSIMEIHNPQDPDNPLCFTRIQDAGEPGITEAELGDLSAKNLGDSNPDPSLGPQAYEGLPSHVDVLTVAPNPKSNQHVYSMDEMLDNEHTQYAGWLAKYRGATYGDVSSNSALQRTMDAHRGDLGFMNYQSRVKEALARQETRSKMDRSPRARAEREAMIKAARKADRLDHGQRTIAVGKYFRELGTKSSLTLSGDMVDEGVFGAYAGPEGDPISRVGSKTIQAKEILNGAEDIQLFGPPTTKNVGMGFEP